MGRSRFLLALGIAALPIAVACTSIVGLDDYTKAQCPGAICDGGGFETGTEAGRDANGGDTGPGSAPVSWARWKMPNYDAGPETSTRASYEVSADTIKDNVTGLIWRKTPGASQRFATAQSQCPPNFRLPTRIELVTLLDQSRTPRVNQVFGIGASEYWTASPVRPVTTPTASYWTVDFNDGNVKTRLADGELPVLCVAGGTP